MSKRLYIMAGILLLASCSPRFERELTLLTYNVGVFSKYQENSIPGVARVILDADASLVAR